MNVTMTILLVTICHIVYIVYNVWNPNIRGVGKILCINDSCWATFSKFWTYFYLSEIVSSLINILFYNRSSINQWGRRVNIFFDLELWIIFYNYRTLTFLLWYLYFIFNSIYFGISIRYIELHITIRDYL